MWHDLSTSSAAESRLPTSSVRCAGRFSLHGSFVPVLSAQVRKPAGKARAYHRLVPTACLPHASCGTDLHILKGDVPTVTPGRILGHEGVGVIEQVGAAVMSFKPGDRVLISCITSCGRCERCREGMYSHCAQGGWILGNTIDGTQAEYARIPFADTSLYRIPKRSTTSRW